MKGRLRLLLDDNGEYESTPRPDVPEEKPFLTPEIADALDLIAVNAPAAKNLVLRQHEFGFVDSDDNSDDEDGDDSAATAEYFQQRAAPKLFTPLIEHSPALMPKMQPEKANLCNGRTDDGHICLQPADQSGFCEYHRQQTDFGTYMLWDEKLYIVLDLDQTLVYTPEEGAQFPDNVSLNIQNIVADGVLMQTAIRPNALSLLDRLESMFHIFVVTGGTPSYCDAIVNLLNRMASRGPESRPVIQKGVSCRVDQYQAQVYPKTFSMVLPDPNTHRFALAIDNCRRAWDSDCRDQVVIVPDWAPFLLEDEQENLLNQVFERVLQVHDRLRKCCCRTKDGLTLPVYIHVGDVLQQLYEEEEKARMLRKALTDRVENVVKLMREKVYL